ncbi:hypothetical protein ACP4OV_016891 [Aristida adscensionis]
MASQSDPAGFAVAVAVGYAHILSSAVGSLERSSNSSSNPVLDKVVAVLLAVPVLMAYLVAVTLAFAVRVAADGYAHVAVCGGGEGGTLAHAAALSPAAVLGWFTNMVVKLAVALVIFSGLAIALFHFLSLPCSPLVTPQL